MHLPAAKKTEANVLTAPPGTQEALNSSEHYPGSSDSLAYFCDAESSIGDVRTAYLVGRFWGFRTNLTNNLITESEQKTFIEPLLPLVFGPLGLLLWC